MLISRMSGSDEIQIRGLVSLENEMNMNDESNVTILRGHKVYLRKIFKIRSTTNSNTTASFMLNYGPFIRNKLIVKMRLTKFSWK